MRQCGQVAHGSQQGNERGVRSLLGGLPLPSVGDNVFHPPKNVVPTPSSNSLIWPLTADEVPLSSCAARLGFMCRGAYANIRGKLNFRVFVRKERLFLFIVKSIHIELYFDTLPPEEF